MNDPDHSLTWTAGIGDDLPERLWALDDITAAADRPGPGVTGGLVSLAFLKSALRRGRRVWAATAILGILIGAGLYVEFPPAATATVSVLLTDNPAQDPAVEIETDAALAQSTTVAGAVVTQLGLSQSPSSLLAAYSVVVVTNRVLQFTVTAPSGADAVQRAGAIATQFLKYRARYAQTQEQQATVELQQQVTAAQQHLDSVTSQLQQARSNGSDQSTIGKLQNQQKAATTALVQVQQYQSNTLMTTRSATQAMVQGSQVLNAATAIKPSHLKGTPLYVGGGLVGGLVVGMAIVAVGALLSDKLLRRDDVAAAFGAPVRLSVGPLSVGQHGAGQQGADPPGPKGRPSLPGGSSKGADAERDLRRVVEHLVHCVSGSSRGPASLAVVAVDDVPTVARVVAAVAERIVEHGGQVLLADISVNRDLARLLGADQPGVRPVNLGGSQVVLAVPEPDDVAPTGPLHGPVSLAGHARPSDLLTVASEASDVLLSLVTLDPAFGGGHLATWAAEAVAVVTAGRSTAARVQAVGEMIRLSGTRVDSAVLLGADKNDESLGAGNATDRPVGI